MIFPNYFPSREFTFKDFLNGACTDIDFKTDRRVPMKDFEEVLKTFKMRGTLNAFSIIFGC